MVAHRGHRRRQRHPRGNARVVRARLATPSSSSTRDRKEPLENRIPGLAHVVYHNKLGSQLERVERITASVWRSRRSSTSTAHVERAARLAKADLRTLMVGEFPELQGIMGEYYARHDGETTDVATAIREHYQPRYAGDALPATKVGLCVALADKLETLVWAVRHRREAHGRTRSVRTARHALGVLRMLMEEGAAAAAAAHARACAFGVRRREGFKPAKPKCPSSCTTACGPVAGQRLYRPRSRRPCRSAPAPRASISCRASSRPCARS